MKGCLKQLAFLLFMAVLFLGTVRELLEGDIVSVDLGVYGRDASFWVKHVPLLPWVPFFAAALRRERQSGFLFPEFGQSSRLGYFAKVPYFGAINES